MTGAGTPVETAQVAELFPPGQREALVRAAKWRDWRAIDGITDELVRLGLCRPRSDVDWQTRAERARAASHLRGV